MSNLRLFAAAICFGSFFASISNRLIKRLSNTAKLKNHFAAQSLRLIGTQAISLLLIVSMLTISTPAATTVGLFASVGEIGQDVRYSLLSQIDLPDISLGSVINSLSAQDVLINLTLGMFAETKLVSKIRRQQQINSIQITPNGATISEGEQIAFNAAALDSSGNPVQGTKFEWTAMPSSDEGAQISLRNGLFEPQFSGDFYVTAEVDGVQAKVRVQVQRDDMMAALKYVSDRTKASDKEGENKFIEFFKRTGRPNPIDKNQFLPPSKYISSREKPSETSEDDAQKSLDKTGGIQNRSACTPNDCAAYCPDCGGGFPTPTPNPTPTPPNTGGGCSPSNYNPQYSWNNTNYYTANDPVQQPANPPNNGTNGAGSNSFSFSAPIISLGGRGDLDLNLSLSYNSLLWHKAGGKMTYDIDKGSPAPGWNVGFGKLMDMGTTSGGMLEGPDGSRHSYEGVLQSNGGGYSTWRGRTTDGSFIDYTIYRNPSKITSAFALFPNGTAIYYGATSNGVSYPTYIEDRHGNTMKVSYCNNVGPKINQVADTKGRIVQFNYDNQKRLISIDGPGQNNTVRTYVRLHYRQLALGYAFAGLTPMVANNAPQVIDSIYYPDTNVGYWFGDADSYSSYGMISKVIEQRGMSWAGVAGDQGTINPGQMSRQMVYNYPLTANGSLTTAPQYTQMSETWANMDTAPATTSYNVQNEANPRTTSTTLPNGNTIVQYSYNMPNQWPDGLLYQVETRSPSNQLLGKTVTAWDLGDYISPRVTEVQSFDEKGQMTKQVFTYDAFSNQVATVKDYGYTGNLLRWKNYLYENGANYRGYKSSNGFWNNGRHIFGLVKIEELFDAGGGRLSRNDYHYDQANLVNAPGVAMYNQSYNPHTTETVTTPGYCLQWQFDYPECELDPYGYVYVGDNPQYLVYCPNHSHCIDYVEEETVSVYDPGTAFRGNLTQTISYADAPNLTGAIVYDSTYDITGNARTTTTDCCQQMSFNYTVNTQYSQPESHTKGSSDPNSAARMTESATYDFNTGHLNSSTDFNGRTTNYAYDNANRLVYTVYPNGLTTQIWNHPAFNLYNELIWEGGTYTHVGHLLNGRGQEILRTEYNKRTENYWDPQNFTDTNITYDQMGRQATVSVPHLQTAATAGYTTYTYDQLSRVTQITAPDGSTSQTFYNETARPDSASQSAGQTVRSQDAWGRQRWARTDDFGRLAEVVEPNPAGDGSVFGAGSLKTSYTYSPKDELLLVDQGGQTRWFAYDSLGRLTRQKLSEQTGTINDGGAFVGANTAASKWSDAFVYDNRSNLIQRTDARGVKTNYIYSNDPLNRLQNVSYDKTGADTPTAIADASPMNLFYMTTGDKTRISQVQTWWTEEYNSYDIEGRISDYTITFPAVNASQPLSTSYLYDTQNRLSEVRYPAQYGVAGSPRKIITPSYDATSRLAQLKVDNQIQMSEIVYNPLSQVTSLKTGAATNNADVETYAYDAQTALLTNQKVIKANTNATLLDLSYGYNRTGGGGASNGTLNGKTGQLTGIVNNLDHNENRFYESDALGRLKAAKGGAASGWNATANWTQNYSYDRYGNRTNIAAQGVTANNQAVPIDGIPNQSYDAASNRITTPGYVYDLAGNLIRGQDASGNWQRYQYDVAGRLTLTSDDAGNYLSGNGYTSSRQRLFRNEPGIGLTWFVWGGSNVIGEYSSAGWGTTLIWQKSYIYAGARLLSTFTNNQSGGETLEFHHPDRLGTKLVTNNTANTSFEQSTLPFGTSLNAETTGTTNQRFTSYDRSAVSSLDYAVNRTYSSAQGRFTSVDPMGMAAINPLIPQSLNLYAYVQNNPIDNIDPSGLNMAGPNTRYGGGLDPMGVAYYVDGMLSDARTAWSHINGGGGWISYENISGLDVITYGHYNQDESFTVDRQIVYTNLSSSTGVNEFGGNPRQADEKDYINCVRAVKNKYNTPPNVTEEQFKNYNLDKKQLNETYALEAKKQNQQLFYDIGKVFIGVLIGARAGGWIGAGLGAVGGAGWALGDRLFGDSQTFESYQLDVKHLIEHHPEAASYDKYMGFKQAEIDACDRYLK